MPTGPVLYTGNNVDVFVNNKLFGFVETLTISRSVNRQNVYAVGSPIRVDAPATQATVTVQANNLVPLNGNSALAGGVVPSGSLQAAVAAGGYPITVKDQKGNTVAQVVNAMYNDDAVTVPNTAILAYNLSWSADDTAGNFVNL